MLLFPAVIFVVAVATILIFNGLVRLRALANNAWADIDVQLKRRHDLVPSLVESVKGYAGHERQTLDAVVAARARAMAAEGPTARGDAEAGLALAVRGVFAVAEAYPQLRAAESYAQLQASLVQIEDAIQNARRYYNAVVRDLNTKVEQVPSNIVAGLFNIGRSEFFQLSSTSEAEAPNISFPERG